LFAFLSLLKVVRETSSNIWKIP